MTRPVTVLLLLKRVDCNDGVASYCETLIKGLNARGDRVVIVSGPVTELYGSAPRRAAIRDAASDWIVLDNPGPGRPNFTVIRKILCVMHKHGVDVISPQGLSLLPLAFLLARFSRKPVVANYHLMTVSSTKAKLAYRLILGVFTPHRLIAISKDIVAFYRQDCGVKSSSYRSHSQWRRHHALPATEFRRTTKI